MTELPELSKQMAGKIVSWETELGQRRGKIQGALVDGQQILMVVECSLSGGLELVYGTKLRFRQ